MSNREKIVVVMAAAALLYGAYEFFLKPSAVPEKKELRAVGQETATLDAFVQDMTTHIMNDQRLKTDRYIIELVSSEWNGSPFIQSEPVFKNKRNEEKKLDALKAKIVYSGYVMAGAGEIALINGMEYEIGDELINPENCCILADISPESASIALKNNGDRFIVPIADEP